MPGPLTERAPGVWTATAEIWTSLTTVVVAENGSCLVVDPGITVADLAGIARAIDDHGWTVTAGLSTHARGPAAGAPSPAGRPPREPRVPSP